MNILNIPELPAKHRKHFNFEVKNSKSGKVLVGEFERAVELFQFK
jgi:hypothetical protein